MRTSNLWLTPILLENESSYLPEYYISLQAIHVENECAGYDVYHYMYRFYIFKVIVERKWTEKNSSIPETCNQFHGRTLRVISLFTKPFLCFLDIAFLFLLRFTLLLFPFFFFLFQFFGWLSFTLCSAIIRPLIPRLQKVCLHVWCFCVGVIYEKKKKKKEK